MPLGPLSRIIGGGAEFLSFFGFAMGFLLNYICSRVRKTHPTQLFLYFKILRHFPNP